MNTLNQTQGSQGYSCFSVSWWCLTRMCVCVFFFLSSQSEHRRGGDRCGGHRGQTRQGTWDQRSFGFWFSHTLQTWCSFISNGIRTCWSVRKWKAWLCVIISDLKRNTVMQEFNPSSDWSSLVGIRGETGQKLVGFGSLSQRAFDSVKPDFLHLHLLFYV